MVNYKVEDCIHQEDVQLIFLTFHSCGCKFEWEDKSLDTVQRKKLQANVWEIKKRLVQRIRGKLHPSNLVNVIFYLVF